METDILFFFFLPKELNKENRTQKFWTGLESLDDCSCSQCNVWKTIESDYSSVKIIWFIMISTLIQLDWYRFFYQTSYYEIYITTCKLHASSWEVIDEKKSEISMNDKDREIFFSPHLTSGSFAVRYYRLCSLDRQGLFFFCMCLFCFVFPHHEGMMSMLTKEPAQPRDSLVRNLLYECGTAMMWSKIVRSYV